MEELITIGVMVAMIVLASAVPKYVDLNTKGTVPGETDKQIGERQDALDRRITDIQDILIAIDEKLHWKN